MATFEAVLEQVLELPTDDQQRLIDRITSMLTGKRKAAITIEQPAKPHPSLLGIYRGKGPVPSAEDIDEARREMWGNFPRDDI